MCVKYNYLKATRNYIAIIYNYNKKGFLSVELCCVCFASLYQQEFCNYRPEGSWQELFSFGCRLRRGAELHRSCRSASPEPLPGNGYSMDWKNMTCKSEGVQKEGQRSGSTHAIASEFPLSRLSRPRLQHKKTMTFFCPQTWHGTWYEWRLQQLPFFAKSSLAAQNPHFYPVRAALASQDTLVAFLKHLSPLGKGFTATDDRTIITTLGESTFGATQNLYEPRAALKLQKILRFL